MGYFLYLTKNATQNCYENNMQEICELYFLTNSRRMEKKWSTCPPGIEVKMFITVDGSFAFCGSEFYNLTVKRR